MKEKWQQTTNYQNFYKASLLFLMQMSMLMLIFYSGYYQKFEELDKDGSPSVVTEDRYKLFLMKLALTMILHIHLQPALLLCIDKMQYLFRHPENFSSMSVPFEIILMKFIVVLTQEIVCIVILTT